MRNVFNFKVWLGVCSLNKFEYTLADVFTTVPFGGNQLAVFENADGLSEELMQKIANELNLSETVFVTSASSPNKTKRVRIFTPKLELPMAGHPTIGTAHVLAAKEIIPTKEGRNDLIFEEGIGDIPVTVFKENHRVIKSEMEQPLPEFGEKLMDLEVAAQLLSLSIEDIDSTLPIQTVSSGVPFLFIPIRSLQAIGKIKFRMDIWEKHFANIPGRQHIFTFTHETIEANSHIHSRMFAPAMGITEDPATGGASGPLGAYLIEYGAFPSEEEGVFYIRGEQGFEMGRPSYIEITLQEENGKLHSVKVGGTSVIIGSGELYL